MSTHDDKQSTLDTLLDEIMQRADAATPGPWAWYGDWGDVPMFNGVDVERLDSEANNDEVIGYRCYPEGSSWLEIGEADAHFIADARTTVPRLVKALRECIRHRDYLIDEYVPINNVVDRKAMAIGMGNAQLLAILEGEDE